MAIPVTLVSGFKGSGKSAVLQQLRKNAGAKSHLSFLEDDGMKDIAFEIEQAIEEASADAGGESTTDSAVDAIVIECAGNMEPFFVAEHLLEGDDEVEPLSDIEVDTLVTVVDGARFLTDLESVDTVSDRGIAFEEDDDRSVSEVLIEQIEFADVLILNKIDLISTERADELEALLSRLNPRAKILRAERGRVPPGEILKTSRFDLEETDDGAGWLFELSGEFTDTDGGFGVSSFSFIEDRPFHPERFAALLENFAVSGLVRAKGYVWLASRHNEIGIWSLAGRTSMLTYGGRWFAATPFREWPTDEQERLEIMQIWSAPFGDRRQEIAFFGLHLNEAEVRARLQSCLLTPNEMTGAPESWVAMRDPLPDWHLIDESSR